MKSFLLICVFGLASVVLALPKKQTSTYTDKYDNINFDEIIANRHILLPIIKCALDQGKCSAPGKELRVHIQDAMESDCERCTETQKVNTKRVLKHIIKEEANYWSQLKAKYDPGNKYAPKYEKEAQE